MRKRILIAVVAALVALGVCGGLIDGCTSADQASKPAGAAQTSAPEVRCNGTGCRPDTFSPSPVAPTTAAKPAITTKPPAPTKPAAPALTLTQMNAIGAAKDYLNIDHFSLKGLTKQLEFDGFTAADAAYGASHAGADWNVQAEGAAKDYLDIDHFSRSGLIKQLEFDGFTAAQAQHGATAAGL